MSLVRQLTEAHGGTIKVQSDGLGTGCAFIVDLPLSLHANGEAEQKRDADSFGRLAEMKVLLVDDSIDVLETMKMLLEMEEALVSAFDDPKRALQAAKSEKYHLIISDIGMPEMNGHELMQAVRQQSKNQQTPSIALTGYGASADVQKSQQSGFTRHLGKPLDYDELIGTIEQLCNIQP